ncbi:hypothetical protein OJ963_41735 [Streptomyces sp. RS2]|uniref:hypothetical protein n=1 Tax=Streptomyces sp. RS2 TaxID=1451205 RepID=UPI0021F8A0BB|nr:hypothetical protein [Streptomyces sp. RS2]MCW1100286.1 hypothetical protein [Streptomyces sp. RS2]
MDGAGRVTPRPFIVFTDVDQREFPVLGAAMRLGRRQLGGRAAVAGTRSCAGRTVRIAS